MLHDVDERLVHGHGRLLGSIAGGLLTLEDARRRWRLSIEEYDAWSRLSLRDTERHQHPAAEEAA